MKRSLLAAAALCLLPLLPRSAHAQVGIYGAGTSSTQSGGITPIGGTFGFFDDVIHAGPVHLGYDAA